MTTELFVIDFSETIITLDQERLQSGQKTAFITNLLKLVPPIGRVDISSISDQIKKVADQGDKTIIEISSKAKLITSDNRSHATQHILKKGESALLHLTGYGARDKDNAHICIRNV